MHGSIVALGLESVSCHAGAALTNNTILPIAEFGTAPTRARSLAEV